MRPAVPIHADSGAIQRSADVLVRIFGRAIETLAVPWLPVLARRFQEAGEDARAPKKGA
jgi:hypothetical protein